MLLNGIRGESTEINSEFFTMADNVQFLTEWPPPSDSEPTKSVDDEASINRKRKLQDEDGFDGDTDTYPLRKQHEGEEDAPVLVSGNVLLSAWWRRKPREEKGNLAVESTKPRAVLEAISKRSDARAYLRKLINEKDTEGSSSWSSLYTIASIHHLLREDEAAFKAITKCMGCIGIDHLHNRMRRSTSSPTSTTSCRSNLDYIKRLSEHQKEILRLATLLGLQTGEIPFNDSSLRDNDFHASGASKASGGHHVDVVHASQLSVEEFKAKYSQRRRPVVIEGLQLTKDSSIQWTMEHIKEVAGDKKVSLRHSKTDSTEWGRLDFSDNEQTTVSDFITDIQKNKYPNGGGYLFDWSLPLFCPELSDDLLIPKYFDNDFLKMASSGSLYSSSWPSLFVSPVANVSHLHVDAFGSNFWMALFQGRKKWTFYSSECFDKLKPRFFETFDPVFEHTEDGSLSPCSVVLEPGQVLFVPAGSPHVVENLEPSVAVSGNFVDESNVKNAITHLQRNALVDPRAGDLLQEWLDLGLIKE